MTKEHKSHPKLGEQDGFVPSYLLYLLAAASDAASQQFHEKVRANGVRVPEWRVLACLDDQDGLMITQLARFALLEQSRMTRIVDQMEKKGLVTRQPDAQDKRRIRVHLTMPGKTLSASLVESAKEHENKLLEGLPKADAAQIKPALIRLLNSL